MSQTSSPGYVLPGIRTSPGNQLSITVYGSKTGVTVSVLWKVENPGQRPAVAQKTFVAPSNRMGTNKLYDIGAGTLTLVEVGVSSSANPQPLRGECYARIGFADDTKSTSTTIARGYAAYQQGVIYSPAGSTNEAAWSGMGVLKTVSGAVPATGAEVADTVPTGARWRLIAAEVVLVTSGAAANRNTNLFVDDAGGTITRKLILTDTTNQITGLTRTHGWYPGTDNDSTASVSVTDTQTVLAKYPMSLQKGFDLLAGDRLRTVTTAIDVGDAYGAARYVVEEWISTDT